MRTYTSEKQPAHSKTRRLSVLCLIALTVCVGVLWGTPHAIPGNGVEAAAKADGVWYVNKSSTSETEDGASWETALRTIQPAVDAAHDAGGGEVWVAQGTYNELRVSWMLYDYGDIDTGSLVMQPGVDLYGGFAGSELNRLDRAAGVYSTVDGSTARGGEPAYHVVVGSDDATLDGFLVTGGNSSHPSWPSWPSHASNGAGMYSRDCSPVVSQCIFRDCCAWYSGGGMYSSGGTPKIDGCVFEGCAALHGGGAYFSDCAVQIDGCLFEGCAAGDGGGAYFSGCAAQINRCTFTYNGDAEDPYGEGGAILQSEGTLLVIDSVFEGNHVRYGSALGVSSANAELVRCVVRDNRGFPVNLYWAFVSFTNCLFEGNLASDAAGCVASAGSQVEMTNCTLSNNFSPDVGAIVISQTSSLSMTNCIVWGNSSPPFYVEPTSTMAVAYSDVEGGYLGEGNISADPQFKDPANGDLGLWWGSPCIDHARSEGAPEDDLVGMVRPQYWGFDMGAYEFVAVDGDGDTMDDAWESEHGLDPGNSLDGAEDPDQDGLRNDEEFLLNTDPHDPADPPEAFYVSNAGSDETGDGSQTEPWATIRRAMTAATMYSTFRPTTVYLDEGVFNEPVVLGESVTLAGQGPALTTIQYFNLSDDEHVVVTAAEDSTLRDCKIKLPGFYTSSTVLLRIADVAATVQNVVFDGNDNLYSLGALISGVDSSASLIEDCTVRRLHFGIQAVDTGANITWTVFEGIRGDAVFVRLPETKSGQAHTPLLGSAAQADTTGGNEFRSVFGSFVLNMSPVVTMAENNDWGVYTQQEIAAKMLGSVDFVPFLGAGEGEGEGEGEPDSGCMGGTFESRGSFNTGDALLLLFAVTTLTLTRYCSARRDG